MMSEFQLANFEQTDYMNLLDTDLNSLSEIFDPAKAESLFNFDCLSDSNGVDDLFSSANNLDALMTNTSNSPVSTFQLNNEYPSAQLHASSTYSSSPASTSSSASSSPSPSTSVLSPINHVDEPKPVVRKKIEPISISLPETEKNGCKVTSEIILNFDQIEDEKKFLDCIASLDQFDEHNILNQLNNDDENGQSKQKCTIELDVDDESDDDDMSYCDSLTSTSNEVKLTEEERALFIKEGHRVPTRMPLTRNEQKQLKLIRRKIRNKKSAHISRERKKKYIEGLEKRIEIYIKENEILQKQLKFLKNQNTEMMKKMKSIQEYVGSMASKHKRSSTAILFVSLLVTFFAYPYLNLNDDPTGVTESTIDAISLSPHQQQQQLPLVTLENDTTLKKTALLTTKRNNNSSSNYDFYWSNYRKKRYEI